MAQDKANSLHNINKKLQKKIADAEDNDRIREMQVIALQMMIADDYEKYEIWRMVLNKQEREEWVASVKELRHHVFERWLKVTT